MKKDIGKRLDELISLRGLRDRQDFLVKTYKALEYENFYEKAQRDKGNFSKMISGERNFNEDIIYGIEKILKVPYIELVENKGEIKMKIEDKLHLNPELAVLTGKYEEFDKIVDKNNYSVFFYNDLYGKNIINYIEENNDITGLKYVISHHNLYYNPILNTFVADKSFIFNDSNEALCNVVFSHDDVEAFNELFRGKDLELNDVSLYSTIYSQTYFIEGILNTKKILESIMSIQKDKVKVSSLEFNTIISNPFASLVLRYALKNVDKYKNQAMQLLTYALDFNKKALNILKDNLIVDKEISENGNKYFKGEKIFGFIYLKNIKSSDKQVNDLIKEVNKVIEDFNKENKKQLDDVIELQELLKDYDAANKDNYSKDAIKMFKETSSKIKQMPQYVKETNGYLCFKKFDYKDEKLKSGSITMMNELLVELVKMFNTLTNATKTNLKGKTYIHNNLENCDIYYKEEGNNKILERVDNWEKVTIGNPELNILDLIINYSNVKYQSSGKDKVIKNMKLVVDTYNNHIDKLADKLIKRINEYINKLNKKDDEFGFDEHILNDYLWARTFVETYKEIINNL